MQITILVMQITMLVMQITMHKREEMQMQMRGRTAITRKDRYRSQQQSVVFCGAQDICITMFARCLQILQASSVRRMFEDVCRQMFTEKFCPMFRDVHSRQMSQRRLKMLDVYREMFVKMFVGKCLPHV